MADLVEMWFSEQVKPEILSSPQPELKKKKLPSKNAFRKSCLLVQSHQKVSTCYAYRASDVLFRSVWHICQQALTEENWGVANLLILHWCHPYSHTWLACTSANQTSSQEEYCCCFCLQSCPCCSFWLALNLHPPKHSHLEHFSSFLIFTLGSSWVELQLDVSPLTFSRAIP